MPRALDTKTLWKSQVNPRYLIQVHRIFCDAQYQCPEATRVPTRILMMRRLGRVWRTRTGRRLQLQSRAQGIALDRCLEIDLRDIMAARVALQKLLVTKKRRKLRPRFVRRTGTF